MRNVYEVVNDYGEKLDEFKSPLSRDWETVLFKTVDILHNIEIEGYTKTKHIENIFLPVIASGRFDEKAINRGIQEVQMINDSGEVLLSKKLKEVLELLFSVKISMNRRR